MDTMNRIQRLDEFLMGDTKTKPVRTTPAPTRTSPAPGPIRRTTPSEAPKPKATVEDAVEHYMDTLRKVSSKIKFNLKKLSDRYESY